MYRRVSCNTAPLILLLISLKISTGIQVDRTNPEHQRSKLGSSDEKNAREIAALKEDIASLKERVEELEVKPDRVGDELVTIPNSIEGIEDSSKSLKKRAAVRRIWIRVPEVAFQASLAEEYATFKIHDAIIFNNVITDSGGAYNKNTGIFTAPVAGIYIFHTNMVSEKGYYIEASIQVNEKVTVSVVSDHRISSKTDSFDIWDQGSASAVLKLKKGDRVCVSVQWPQGSHVVHGIGKTSFSGYLSRSHKVGFEIE